MSLHIYIYIYIYRERERERMSAVLGGVWVIHTGNGINKPIIFLAEAEAVYNPLALVPLEMI